MGSPVEAQDCRNLPVLSAVLLDWAGSNVSASAQPSEKAIKYGRRPRNRELPSAINGVLRVLRHSPFAAPATGALVSRLTNHSAAANLCLGNSVEIAIARQSRAELEFVPNSRLETNAARPPTVPLPEGRSVAPPPATGRALRCQAFGS